MTPVSYRSVIIVDDEASVREALASLLRSSGLRVASFASAEDLLRAASPDDVVCLILDINLPGMSGLELQQYFLADQRWQCIPIIFITAGDDRDGRIRARALRDGARAFLPKPFIDDELIRAVHSAAACGATE